MVKTNGKDILVALVGLTAEGFVPVRRLHRGV